MKKGIQYYWCVNCGCTKDFGKVRKKKLICENCGYDAILMLELKEYLEDMEKQKEI